MNESTESQATAPTGSEVSHIHTPVALRLLLTPRQ